MPAPISPKIVPGYRGVSMYQKVVYQVPMGLVRPVGDQGGLT